MIFNGRYLREFISSVFFMYMEKVIYLYKYFSSFCIDYDRLWRKPLSNDQTSICEMIMAVS